MDLNGLLDRGAKAVIRVPSLEGCLRIQDEDGDVFLYRGKNRRGVKNFGAEVGELGGLLKADVADAEGVGADARVRGHDAVDVGPDFDGAGEECFAEQRGGVVGAAAAERGGDAGCVLSR